MRKSPDNGRPHPCFSSKAAHAAERLYLPVAPRATAMLRFPPELPPRTALSPQEALAYLGAALDRGSSPSMVSLTGPGDPLATPDTTLSALDMIREAYPDLPKTLATNGLGGAMAAKELACTGLSHVTVFVNAVKPEAAEKLYLWIRPGAKTLPLPEACRVLVQEQTKAIRAFKNEGMTVKVNTTVFTGLNAGHVEEVAQTVAGLGADCMALTACPASVDDNAPFPPGTELLAMVRDRAARHLNLVPSFEECGLNAAPTLEPSTPKPGPTDGRPNVAVVSSSGMDVDLHLGHAQQFLIYGRRRGLIQLLETRPAPEPGGGDSRWRTAADTLKDCYALLAASAGLRPREVFADDGIKIVIADGSIEGTVEALYGEGRKCGKGRANA